MVCYLESMLHWFMFYSQHIRCGWLCLNVTRVCSVNGLKEGLTISHLLPARRAPPPHNYVIRVRDCLDEQFPEYVHQIYLRWIVTYCAISIQRCTL